MKRESEQSLVTTAEQLSGFPGLYPYRCWSPKFNQQVSKCCQRRQRDRTSVAKPHGLNRTFQLRTCCTLNDSWSTAVLRGRSPAQRRPQPGSMPQIAKQVNKGCRDSSDETSVQQSALCPRDSQGERRGPLYPLCRVWAVVHSAHTHKTGKCVAQAINPSTGEAEGRGSL